MATPLDERTSGNLGDIRADLSQLVENDSSLKKGYGQIYKIQGPNDKPYIGQCSCFRLDENVKHGFYRRFLQHLQEASKGTMSGCRKLNCALRLHGASSFNVFPLVTCKLEKLDEWEVFFIKEFDSIKNGYNLTEGGKRGHVSHETRQLQSDKRRGDKHHQFGRPLNDETKKKLSEFNINRTVRYDHLGRVLPKYIKYESREGDRIGFRVISHPSLKNRSFSDKKLTLDELLEKAMEYLELTSK